ncbi:MAG TPA: NADPH:quinone oxidoreductase family protein, partial [Woeseiaceae bacterium]|nr:NADPH:quinone oxidoreductase family protein [Woeseiaceae bacterium]
VDVAAAGINFPDILAIAGKYQVKSPTPFIPGNEAAGVVAAVGEGVTHFSVGDKVIFNSLGGAFAEQCVADQRKSMHLPDSLSLEQGAGFTVTYGTSYHALCQCADIQAGESILVLGAAGGVGIAAVEIAKALGARVIAAASSDRKLEFAKEAGADELVNYSTQPLKDTVKALTDGKGVDIVYDPVGGELAQQAFRATGWHGRHLVVGFASGDIPQFPANIALLKEASIVGVWWGTWAMKNPKLQSQNMQALATLIDAGKLTPRVTESYPLDDFRDAFSAISDRRARGKVILLFNK